MNKATTELPTGFAAGHLTGPGLASQVYQQSIESPVIDAMQNQRVQHITPNGAAILPLGPTEKSCGGRAGAAHSWYPRASKLFWQLHPVTVEAQRAFSNRRCRVFGDCPKKAYLAEPKADQD
jgi:hypothetical protein